MFSAEVSAFSTNELPDVQRFRSGKSGISPLNAGQNSLKEHQAHNLLGDGEKDFMSAARSIADRIARILFSVAIKSGISGWYRRYCPSAKYMI